MKNITVLIILLVFIQACKSKINSLDDILREHQWRKTEKAIYNTNNEFEEYLFTFEDAEDCKKNTFLNYTGISSIEKYGGVRYSDFCTNDYRHPYKYFIINDSLIIRPYNSDTISTFYLAKHIDYYDEANKNKNTTTSNNINNFL